MKGLVLGPIHKTKRDDAHGTNLQEIDPALGSMEDFEGLLQSAKKKGGCLWGGPEGPRRRQGSSEQGLGLLAGAGRGGFVCLAPGCLGFPAGTGAGRPQPKGTSHLTVQTFHFLGFSADVFQKGFYEVGGF